MVFWCSVASVVSLESLRAVRSSERNLRIALWLEASFLVETSSLVTKLSLPLTSTEYSIGQQPWPAASTVLEETHSTHVYGRCGGLSCDTLISRVASATLMLLSWPTQHTALPLWLKLTLCTQPPTPLEQENSASVWR